VVFWCFNSRLCFQIIELVPLRSGAISWFEFDKALTDLGVNVNQAELEHLMEIFDSDGDGELYWTEFVEWCDDRVPLSMVGAVPPLTPPDPVAP
jgi:hypothetical protein